MKKIINTTIVIGIICALFLMMRKEMSTLENKIIHLNGKHTPSPEVVHTTPSPAVHLVR